MPALPPALLVRQSLRRASARRAREEQTRSFGRYISTLRANLNNASREVAVLQSQLKAQRHICARQAHTIHRLRRERTITNRTLHYKHSSDSHARASRNDTDLLALTGPDAAAGTLERELELQRILASESRRHAEEIEESYREILTFKDAQLAGSRADNADLAARLRVTRKELRRAQVEVEDCSLRGELRALEAELNEQYELLTHAARNAVENANRMAALVRENTTLRHEHGDLEEVRDILAARVEALESTRAETEEQRAFEANFLENLRDELASATAYTTASNSPDLAATDTDLRSGLSSPFLHLPNISASSLLDEDIPSSLPLSPRSPSYTTPVRVSVSSPPPRYSHPASVDHSRFTSLCSATLAVTDGPSPAGISSPAMPLPSLPSSDPVAIRAFELSLDEYMQQPEVQPRIPNSR